MKCVDRCIWYAIMLWLLSLLNFRAASLRVCEKYDIPDTAQMSLIWIKRHGYIVKMNIDSFSTC